MICNRVQRLVNHAESRNHLDRELELNPFRRAMTRNALRVVNAG